MRVVISGIGTGGHYFPAIVVAQEFMKCKVDVIFLARRGYSEEEVARKYGLRIFYVESKPFFGKSIFMKLLSLLSIVYSAISLNNITKQVIGFACGGFGSLPLLISCFMNRSPFYLFEPNRIPGRATKLFARRARKVFLGLPLLGRRDDNMILTGIPIRTEFKECHRKRLSAEKKEKKILFLGGSQGAMRLNRLALEIQDMLPRGYTLTIISGKRDFDWVDGNRRGRTRVLSFTLSPWEEMKKADVIVSRSGALAGYEILSLDIPVIFIPFPYAVDDHQYYNAEYFAETGNAVVMREEEVTAEILLKKIMELSSIRKKKVTLDFNAEKKIVDFILKENG